MGTLLTTGVTVTPEMVIELRGEPLTRAAIERARVVYPGHNSEESDMACAWLYGALCAIRGTVMSCPTGLDRLQQDSFWLGVEWAETKQDELAGGY